MVVVVCAGAAAAARGVVIMVVVVVGVVVVMMGEVVLGVVNIRLDVVRLDVVVGVEDECSTKNAIIATIRAMNNNTKRIDGIMDLSEKKYHQSVSIF